MADYKEIGNLLLAARMDKRMTQESAARALHIRLLYIKALESGDLSQLPGLLYVRGYLQTYATFLGLDKDEVLRRFEQVERALGRSGIYFPKVFSKDKRPTPRMIWGGLVAAAMIYWIGTGPSGGALSLVELISAPPPAPISLPIIADSDEACFEDEIVLYPPCTMFGERAFAPLPLHRQQGSVMELAEIKLAQ